MDTTASDIDFDADGICNYCTNFLVKLGESRKLLVDYPRQRDRFVASVKSNGRGKEYDCIVGVSGGVDSSYALYLAIEHGLRPLAVHLDNGWNSELATHNIANLIERLNVDLYTHVIDWEENRELQRSLFKANVVDIEILMDNAMYALNYRQAARRRVRYILAGTNTTTEGLALPKGWNHYKLDVRNIRRIHTRFGSVPIKSHPLISTVGHIWMERIKRINWVSFLDYFPYNKSEAEEVLKREVGFRPYSHKHYESVFTRFYQAYILPRKFGVDKRRVHLSTLVVSGHLPRDEAVKMLGQPPYSDPREEEQDREFVMKKLGFSEREFEDYMRGPAVPHEVYGSEVKLHNTLSNIYGTSRRLVRTLMRRRPV